MTPPTRDRLGRAIVVLADGSVWRGYPGQSMRLVEPPTAYAAPLREVLHARRLAVLTDPLPSLTAYVMEDKSRDR